MLGYVVLGEGCVGIRFLVLKGKSEGKVRGSGSERLAEDQVTSDRNSGLESKRTRRLVE